jgi:hypothetical protein
MTKKEFVLCLMAMTLILNIATSARAVLYNRGNGLIYDDDLDITWLQYSNYAEQTMNWDEANLWVTDLVYMDYTDWRLPYSDISCTGSGCIDSEMGHLFYTEEITSAAPGQFIDIRPSIYWSAAENTDNNSQAWRFSLKYGTQGISDKTQNRYAWAVRDGDSTLPVVPEPISSALFITGGVTLGIRRLWKKKIDI